MTDKEPIDQIVRFLNDIDIPEVSIYFFNFCICCPYADTILGWYSNWQLIWSGCCTWWLQFIRCWESWRNWWRRWRETRKLFFNFNGSFKCKYHALIAFAYANYIQHQITKYGVVVSSNGPKKIIVDEIQEHMIIPDYPHTKDSAVGILHIVHMKNPWQDGMVPENLSSINDTFAKLTSHICFINYMTA